MTLSPVAATVRAKIEQGMNDEECATPGLIKSNGSAMAQEVVTKI